MKAVAFNIKPFEKEFLAKANRKKHDITLISNALSVKTANYARCKQAIIVSAHDKVSGKIIQILADMGVKYIITRSGGLDHIDKAAAAKYGIKLADIPDYPTAGTNGRASSMVLLDDTLLRYVADQTIMDLDVWQQGESMGQSMFYR